MNGPKTEIRKAKETEIRIKEAEAKSVLSEVVHEAQSLEEGDTDTKMIRVVDAAVESARRRIDEAKASK